LSVRRSLTLLHPIAAFAGALLAFVAGSSREALAISAGCAATNSGGLNYSFSGGNQGAAVSGFVAGDVVTATWVVTSTSGNVAFDILEAPSGTTLANTFGPSPATFTLTYKVTGNGDTSVYLFNTGQIGTATATCTPSTGGNTDSQKLRSLEIAATKTVATNSGAAITGAINDAIGDVFNNGAAPITLGPNGLFLNFAAEPQRDAATQEAIDALAYAGGAGMVTKTPPPAPLIHSDWSAWADLRGTGFDQNNAAGSDHEEQVNVTGGVGRKLSPNLVVGLFTGYENFSDTIESLAGKLTGDGGTIGTYAAWRYADHWRVDGMFGWSDMSYNGTAGTASGSFTGSRWLGSGGFTGNYRWSNFVLEPSASIYALWETDSAFTDSLGTEQAERIFSVGRASAGGKVSDPWQASSTLSVVPYLGLYTDYRFSTDTALPVGIPYVGIKDGWSERVTGGVTFANGNRGPTFAIGGDLGGLGAGYDIWSANVRADLPF
jgi:hypothetical protein